MREVDLTAPIVTLDGTFYFLEQRDGLISLKSESGSVVVWHPAYLSQRVVGMAPEAITNARLITSVSEKQQDRTYQLADHMREVQTGIHPQLKASRPQFDLATTTQEQRVQAKLLELEATDLRMARSTFFKNYYAFQKGGAAALVDGRALSRVRTKSEDRRIIEDAMLHVLAGQAKESTGTIRRIIHLTWKEVLSRYGADAPERPSEQTMRRLYKKYSRGRHSTGSAKTRRSLADRPDTPFKKRLQTLPGAEVQLDTQVLDMYVNVPGVGETRPHLTIMMDIATRSILAFTLRLVAAKGIDHVALIGQALTPIQNLPDRTKFREMVQLQNPEHPLLGPERLADLARHRPFVFPRSLTIDNGRDFKSNVVTAAAETFHMNVVFSPPGTPTAKPIVERTFRSIGSMFVQYLPGYLGRSPEFRGYGIEKRTDLLDLYAVQELFHDWVLDVWQNHPHEELRDPLHPGVMFSPNQMVAAAAGVVSTFRLPLTREDYIGLLPKESRVLRSTGFHFHNHRYDAPELHALRGRVHTMDVHSDPYNPAVVWAKAPDGAFIECHIRDWDAMTNPFFAEFQPEGTELPEPDPIAEARAEAALIGTALSGVNLHAAPVATRELERQPTKFFDADDDDLEELTEFDPTKDL